MDFYFLNLDLISPPFCRECLLSASIEIIAFLVLITVFPRISTPALIVFVGQMYPLSFFKIPENYI